MSAVSAPDRGVLLRQPEQTNTDSLYFTTVLEYAGHGANDS